jgi:hypothetical protein
MAEKGQLNGNEPLPHRTHLFTLRLWPEALGDGQTE